MPAVPSNAWLSGTFMPERQAAYASRLLQADQTRSFSSASVPCRDSASSVTDCAHSSSPLHVLMQAQAQPLQARVPTTQPMP